MSAVQVLVAKAGQVMLLCATQHHVKLYPTIKNYTGEDWRHARVATDVKTSQLHILKPAGLELDIQRSILQQDAFLPRQVL